MGHNRSMSRVPYAPAAVGQRIRQTREAFGHYNAAEFARLIGVKPQELNAWEKGERRPSIAKAQPIVRLCNVTLDWIFLGDPSTLRHEVASRLFAQAPVAAQQNPD